MPANTLYSRLFFKGEWETRLIGPDPSLPSEVVEGGHTLPLLLTARLSRSPFGCTLQHLVDQWERQPWQHRPARQAIVDTPELLVLQVARFSDVGAKIRGIIKPPYVVEIPCFSSHHTDVRRIRYEVVSIVYHLGPTSRSGHYRSVTAVRCRASRRHGGWCGR